MWVECGVRRSILKISEFAASIPPPAAMSSVRVAMPCKRSPQTLPAIGVSTGRSSHVPLTVNGFDVT